MKHALAIAVVAACGAASPATPAVAPAPIVAATTPTREQCDRLLTHLIDLEFAQTGTSHDPASATAVFDAKRDEFRSACGKTPRTRVECALAGRDLDVVAKCDQPR